MTSHARKRMPTLAALLLIVLLAILPTLRSAATALPPLQAESGQAVAPDPQAGTQDTSRSSADQLAYDDTPVLPAAPWRPIRSAPIWREPAAWHGAGTHPRPRLRPPSA
ncbi:hypothetical protein [Xanthomonas tesorieronis]|uniref:hypothetical protein n=1 Tax=Xanthomonas tesorieronis TaxID=3160839 RepID=UPI003517F15A